MTKPVSRRRLLMGAAYTGIALSVSGCCAFRRCVLPVDCSTPLAVGGGVTDTHCHIFNGSDLQVAAFLAGPVAKEYPQFEDLIQAAAPFVERISDRLAPDAQREHRRLDRIQDPFPGDAATLAREVEQDKAVAHAQFGDALMTELAANANFATQLNEVLARKDVTMATLNPDARDLLSGTSTSGLAAYNGARQIDSSMGFNFFGYVSRFLYYRYINAVELIATYGCDTNNNVQTFVAALVDFDYPLAGGQPTRTTLSDQVGLMARISTLTDGRMKFLVPFCPFKESADSNKTSSSLVRYALDKPGFVGTKLYPPMGFYPYGNEKFGVAKGKLLDQKLADFFAICVEKNVPVMAHSSPSLCAQSGPCRTPGPEGWEEALKFVFAKHGVVLRASLGHFGEFPAVKLNWSEKFMNLMSKPHGAGLFADLSYIDEALSPGGEQGVAAALTTLVQRYPAVAPDRIMYGSDWLMLSIERDWQDYYQKMRSILALVETRTGVTGLAQNMLTRNAANWLK